MSADSTFAIVDVFTVGPMTGNQLAVVRLSDAAALAPDAPGERLQQVAAEFGFSETVFLPHDPDPHEPIPVRIFTPGRELPFAGHPTLGAAWEIRRGLTASGRPCPVRLTLAERVGPIPVWFDAEGTDALVWMRQNQPEFGAHLDRASTARALSLEPGDLQDDIPVCLVSTGVPYAIVPLRTIDAVTRAKEVLQHTAAPFETAGVAPTAWFVFARGHQASPDPTGYHARMFAQAFGIAEDPATGSANGCFAGYLSRYVWGTSGGIGQSVVEQGYEMGRPSRLYLRVSKEGDAINIEVGGSVSLFATGSLPGVGF